MGVRIVCVQRKTSLLTQRLYIVQNPSYWEGVYRQLGPHDVFEWGNLTCSDLSSYRYRCHDYVGSHQSIQVNEKPPEIETTLGETVGVFPHGASDGPVMILGCGNSKFGEDMLHEGWKGPIIQVDIASRVIESMSQRCAAYQRTGDMQFVQDDATLLSAFENDKLAAALDKGLIDALFCADAHEQCHDIMRAVHRVLIPGAHFVVLSFSRPEFFMEKILVPPTRHMWQDVQVRELDRILLYRFQKAAKAARAIRTRKSRAIKR